MHLFTLGLGLLRPLHLIVEKAWEQKKPARGPGYIEPQRGEESGQRRSDACNGVPEVTLQLNILRTKNS